MVVLVVVLSVNVDSDGTLDRHSGGAHKSIELTTRRLSACHGDAGVEARLEGDGESLSTVWHVGVHGLHVEDA